MDIEQAPRERNLESLLCFKAMTWTEWQRKREENPGLRIIVMDPV